jgi:hypothetical protein
MTCNRSLLNFLVYEENLVFFFISALEQAEVRKSMIILCWEHDMAEQGAFDTGRTSFFENI